MGADSIAVPYYFTKSRNKKYFHKNN